ncbi:complex III assembly factor LYRM7 [Diorhabda carinulata]|uniref:complex III assembly factor LYRM7 n=1 Tax=Diorhabda sublineata TaxID=1163346 RepID=UPI0024E0768B|nr:complex III assembly factor LYRM7 [Diorhabda sublineata]XP_057653094.1 complex III assembly factor LYRM7 [Diorhabda carinulata]
MSVNIRRQVLKTFKELHKTRKTVFQGDLTALSEARKRINEEYKKCKHVTDLKAIEELIKYSQDVERELRTTVIQAREVKPGIYEAKITKDTVKLDNIPFSECASKQKG